MKVIVSIMAVTGVTEPVGSMHYDRMHLHDSFYHIRYRLRSQRFETSVGFVRQMVITIVAILFPLLTGWDERAPKGDPVSFEAIIGKPL